MTTMIAGLYDALIATGSPEDKARKSAEAMGGYEAYEQHFARIEADIGELERDAAELKHDNLSMKRVLGFVLAFQVAMFFKLFLH